MQGGSTDLEGGARGATMEGAKEKGEVEDGAVVEMGREDLGWGRVVVRGVGGMARAVWVWVVVVDSARVAQAEGSLSVSLSPAYHV